MITNVFLRVNYFVETLEVAKSATVLFSVLLVVGRKLGVDFLKLLW